MPSVEITTVIPDDAVLVDSPITVLSQLVSLAGPPGPAGSGGAGAVASVFGRTGVVVADPADYAADYDPLGAADTAQAYAVQRAHHTGTQLLATISDAGTAASHPATDFDAAGAAAGVLVTAEAYTDTKVAAEVTRANGAYDALGAAAAAQAAAIAASQPLDADLTAIAALTTTSFGRALLTQADAAALRTAAGLGTAATHPATDFDSSGAAATAQAAAIAAAATDATTKANAAQAASQPLDSDLTAIAALTTTSFGRSFLALADAAAGRTLLGLGTLATQSGTFSGTSSGTNTGDQTLPTTLPPNGAAGGVLTGTYPNPSGLAATTVTAAAYGSATSVPTFTVGADGRLTAAGTVSIAIPESAVTNLTTDLAAKAPLASPALTGSPTVNGSALSGANTGDQTISITGDVTASGSTGALAATVGKLNGTSLAGLATGLLKNTTSTGVPSIAAAADVPTVAAGGTGPLSASDASTTNSRAPSGTAGGDLAGTYPNPTLAVDRIAKSIGTAKGDQIGFTASGTPVRHAIGADGTVQTADSAQADGWKWAAPAGAVPTNYLAPTGALYETFPRQFVTGGATIANTGRLYLYGISLPAGLTIGHIAFLSSGAAGTPTHWWFGLYDSSRVQLALTADQTSTAWGATTVQSLAIATVASGAASSFTTTYSGMYYLGYMMTATTPTTLLGSNTSATTPALAPILLGQSDTGQTTPPAFPHTATTISATATNAYGYVAA